MELKIIKDNSLIDNFIFNASENELQILNYAVAITNPYWDKNDRVYKISISELVQVYGGKNNKRAWEQYRSALYRLQVRTYSFYVHKEKRTEPLIKQAREHMEDKTYLAFVFNDYVANRLQNLRGFFTKYDIKNIVKFSSRYAFLLYEFFKMKLQQLDGVYTQKIEAALFKENLNITDKYSRFSNLKDFVLIPAKTQINKHSDINLDYQVIKTGRTPTHIKFTAKYKKKAQPKELDKELENKTAKPVEQQTQLPLDEEQSTTVGFTEKHKATSKPHLDNLKQKWI